MTFNLFQSFCNSVPKLLSSPYGSSPYLSNIIHSGDGGEGGPVFLLLWCCCPQRLLPSLYPRLKPGADGYFHRQLMGDPDNQSIMIVCADCSALTCSLSPVAPPHLVLADCLSSTWPFLSSLICRVSFLSMNKLTCF